jgi:hypothetical protein
VIRALLQSIAAKEGRPMYVYARAPYYPVFVVWANDNPRVSVFTNATDLDPKDVIEIVTWVRF